MKKISFFFCIFALILTKIVWEIRSKFGDIKNEERDNFNEHYNDNQNYGKFDKFYSDLFFEFLLIICSLPMIIFIIKTENKETNKITDKIETIKINKISGIKESNSIDDMKNKNNFIDENENEIKTKSFEHNKDSGQLARSQFYYFTSTLFYMSRISLILYWNLDKNSQIKLPIISQIIDLFPLFNPTKLKKWHLILPNIILSNCFLVLMIITIICLTQISSYFYNFTKKVEKKKIEENKSIDINEENNYFIIYLLQERFNLYLLFISFCHFSNFYILSLGSRSAPILSISLLIFISIAISFVLVYLSYNNKSNEDENKKKRSVNHDGNNSDSNYSRNINIIIDKSNNITDTEVRNYNNNTKKNIKYSITSTLTKNYILEKNLLLAAFVLHIGMFSRMFFFISGHNFDFGSLQVPNFFLNFFYLI